MECPPPLFELQFDEHFESDCVTEDGVDNGKWDIENINLLTFIVIIVNVIFIFIPSGFCI